MMRALLRSRKAVIFNILLVLITVVVLTYGLVQVGDKYRKIDREIGEEPFKVVAKVQQGENALIFLDLSARMALRQAVYDLHSRGGMTGTGCGTYYGFRMWNSASGEDCAPDMESAEQALKDLFLSNLQARVSAYPYADFAGDLPSSAVSAGAAVAAEEVDGELQCPSGMRLLQGGASGTSSSVTGSPGFSAAQLTSENVGALVLADAHCYKGRGYGNGPTEFVCVSFVEQVLKDLGVEVTKDMHRKIFIQSGTGKSGHELVESNHESIRGVELALVSEGIGASVPVDGARRGDFVQYWFKRGDEWAGHSVVIERKRDDGLFDVFGAHEGKKGVDVLRGVNLAGPGVKAFIARLDPSAVDIDAAGFACPAAASICMPGSTFSATLYDFVVNSSGGMTTLVGVARQNIAVGRDREYSPLPLGVECRMSGPVRDYDVDYLRRTYGHNDQLIRANLDAVKFMGVDVEVHRLVTGALRCVQKRIKTSCSGVEYGFRTIDSYRPLGGRDDPEHPPAGCFGISLEINRDTNPDRQDGELVTDIPDCVIDAFKAYGFEWGGDFRDTKRPSLFRFMADPEDVEIIGR